MDWVVLAKTLINYFSQRRDEKKLEFGAEKKFSTIFYAIF